VHLLANPGDEKAPTNVNILGSDEVGTSVSGIYRHHRAETASAFEELVALQAFSMLSPPRGP
jgi:hypothetical protein